MTNTINVPRELLENIVLCYNEGEFELGTLAAECHAILSAPSPAGVDGLEVVGTLRYFMDYPDSPHSAPGYITHQLNPASWDHAGEAAGEHKLCRLSDAQAIIDGLLGEVADLHTTMMAAAVEIQEHWAAHCDEEGYGPANLMHRLERGIASQYGYSAETLVRLESQRDKLAQRIGELEGLLRISSELLTTISAHAGTKPDDWCGAFKREVQDRIKRIDAALAGKAAQA